MSEQRVVIVGAGVLGAAISWKLASRGVGVTIFDPEPGGVASPGSFAWLNASFADHPVYNALRRDSLVLWRELVDNDPSVPVVFKRVGGVGTGTLRPRRPARESRRSRPPRLPRRRFRGQRTVWFGESPT